ncbi:hypothetical protein N752_04920 [Desulforamulus aquiferis]|nr:cache domain-containing protein [Desulforamulus aquiferis]RYD06235.1 hypothetical protein N752_04920 [Desulforamulus aquiferis]
MLKRLKSILTPLMPSFIRDSLRLKILALVMLSLLILGFGSLSIVYYHELKINNERIENNFSLIADILENDTNRWLTERINNVKMMSVNPQVNCAIQDIISESENSVAAEIKLVNYWDQMLQQYGIYDEIYFVAERGKILVSTDEQRKGTFRPRDEIITRPLESGEIYIENAYLSYKTQKPSIAFSVPIKDTNNSIDNEAYLGVLVFRLDIDAVLKPMLESRMNLGRTGEVMLIKQDKTTIIELRNQPGSALNYKIDSEPAKRVSEGESGIWYGKGYNGSDIIAVYRYIPKVQWGIIIRQESAEILAPLQKSIYYSMALISITGILILAILYFLINRSLKPITIMAGVAADVAQGDFNKRINVENKDEIGQLGSILNKMASDLGQRFKLRSSRHQVLHTLVSTLDTKELLNNGLQTLCQCFQFKVGAIYLANHQEGTLLLKALYCPGSNLINQREKINIGEGLEGLAVTSRELQVLTDVPADTIYTVDWSGGTLIPRVIIQVPIVYGQEVLGVISLASLEHVPSEIIEELGVIGTLTGIALNHALSYQKACELSNCLQEMNEQLAQQNEELNAKVKRCRLKQKS